GRRLAPDRERGRAEVVRSAWVSALDELVGAEQELHRAAHPIRDPGLERALVSVAWLQRATMAHLAEQQVSRIDHAVSRQVDAVGPRTAPGACRALVSHLPGHLDEV